MSQKEREQRRMARYFEAYAQREAIRKIFTLTPIAYAVRTALRRKK